MTLEGHPGEEQTPTPPARTRLSGDAAEDDDILLPPFVPGARAAAQARGTPGPTGAARPASPPSGDAAARSSEPVAPADDTGFAFPWEGEGGEDVPGEDGPAPEDAYEPWAEAPASGDADSTGMAAPETPATPDAGGEPWSEAEPWAPEPWAVEPAGGAAPSAGTPLPAEEEDAFPFEAFDIEGGPDEGQAYAEEAVEVAGTAAREPSGAAPGDPGELARRVEALAAMLRSEGVPGVQRALNSRDRLTSLLAGVLAGYLAGIED